MMTAFPPGARFARTDTAAAREEVLAAGIIAGVATVAVIGLTNATIGTLVPSLPQWVQDLNVGIIALVVNFVVLAVVSFAVRTFASPHRVVHSR